MSMATRATSARQRATIAANMIKKNQEFGRAFDDCFEMCDGDEVMEWIIVKARKDAKLARALKEKMPLLGHGDSNTRMHEAIEECLSEEIGLFLL